MDLLNQLVTDIQNHLVVEIIQERPDHTFVRVTNPKIGSGGIYYRDLRIRQGNRSMRLGQTLGVGSSLEKDIDLKHGPVIIDARADSIFIQTESEEK